MSIQTCRPWTRRAPLALGSAADLLDAVSPAWPPPSASEAWSLPSWSAMRESWIPGLWGLCCMKGPQGVSGLLGGRPGTSRILKSRRCLCSAGLALNHRVTGADGEVGPQGWEAGVPPPGRLTDVCSPSVHGVLWGQELGYPVVQMRKPRLRVGSWSGRPDI